MANNEKLFNSGHVVKAFCDNVCVQCHNCLHLIRCRENILYTNAECKSIGSMEWETSSNKFKAFSKGMLRMQPIRSLKFALCRVK